MILEKADKASVCGQDNAERTASTSASDLPESAAPDGIDSNTGSWLRVAVAWRRSRPGCLDEGSAATTCMPSGLVQAGCRPAASTQPGPVRRAMSDLAEEFAVNCNPGAPAKPPRYAGRAQAQGHVRAMLHDVRSAHLAGKHKKAKHRIQRYLNSHHALLVATELACRKMKPHRRLPKALVPAIASGLDPWAGTAEEVRVNMIPKDSDSGDYRLTMDFGPENRAFQYLLSPLLREIAGQHPISLEAEDEVPPRP
jgi:hypothetical protein